MSGAADGVDLQRPIIGLSNYGIAPADGFNIPAEYVQAVLRAGGLPLLLPTASIDAVNRWLEKIQGFVGPFSGPGRQGLSAKFTGT